jgi:hypothetical protein
MKYHPDESAKRKEEQMKAVKVIPSFFSLKIV